MDAAALKSILLAVFQRNVRHNDVAHLVLLTRGIAQAYLYSHRQSIVTLCGILGFSIPDLAIDCIADAFSKTRNDDLGNLQNFITSLNDSIEALPPGEIFLAYNRYIIRIVEAQLTRLYEQADPAGGKIHRNLRDAITKSGIFILNRDFRGLILYPANEPDSDHLPELPTDLLQQELACRVHPSDSTTAILSVLLEILEGQDMFRRSIRLIDLVQMLKKISKLELEEQSPAEPNGSLFGATIDMEKMRSDIEAVIKEKILVTYFMKRKLSRDETEAVWLGCRDLIGELCTGGDDSLSLMSYLQRYLTVTETEFEDNFRAKMEYLQKLIKNEFRARLSEGL